jgi:hypothetical protein
MVQSKIARPSRPYRALLGSVAAAGLLLMSCDATPSIPGTQLGTYNVTGSLGTNTCGAGLGAPSPWTFTVQLSEDSSTSPTTFYWLSSTGTQLSSAMTSTTAVNISDTVTSNLGGSTATDASVGTEGPCDLTQSTALTLTLANENPPGSFTGTMTYSFVVATGVSTSSDCTDELSTSGGQFDTLPCTTTYTLTASHQ